MDRFYGLQREYELKNSEINSMSYKDGPNNNNDKFNINNIKIDVKRTTTEENYIICIHTVY